ncbi:MAG: helix-turn-helix transcriptional regulator [Clostridia bacterium]
MIKLLIVADNRLFVRRIYVLLQDCPEVTIHVAFQSANIFEAYAAHPSDVVVMDAGTYVPYASIVNQFHEFQWHCLFLIANCNQIPPERFPMPVVFVDLQRDHLPKIMEDHLALSLEKAFPSPLQPMTNDDGERLSSVELYSLALFICLEPNHAPYEKSELQSLRKQLAAVLKIEIFTQMQANLLILVKKSAVEQPDALTKLGKILSSVLSVPFGLLYLERLSLHELDKSCATLLSCAPLSYCFAAQSMSLTQLSAIRKNRPRKSVYPFFTQLISLLLQGNQSALLSGLREFYLYWVKEYADMQALDEFRLWQAFFENTLFQHYIQQPFLRKESIGTIEAECEAICLAWNHQMRRYCEAPFLPVVEASIHELLTNFSDTDFSLEGLANHIGFAKAYVSRVFKEQTGLTLIDFLQRLRLQHGAWLLQMTELPIKEIALKTGYCDAQYFSKAFRLHVGLYPTEYRSLQKKENPYACIDS